MDNNKQIWWGIRNDGSVFQNNQIEKQLSDRLLTVINDREWEFAVIDNVGQVYFGIRRDNSIYPFDSLINNIEEIINNSSNVGHGNHTKETSLQLPFPRSLARVDFVGDLTGIGKDDAVNVMLKFNDMQGNYFEKPIELTYQGSSSMAYPKKNYAFDMFNDDGSDFVVKFGEWVGTNSYHFKANYIDFTHARNIVCARMAHQTNKSYPIGQQFPWEVPYNPDNATITDRYDTGARGVIDGFPVEIFINGVYQGLFTWNLKKHRDNYHMVKDNPNNIQFEMLGNSQFVYPVLWDKWEIRNPKGFDAAVEPANGVVKDNINRFFQWAATVHQNNFKAQAPDYLHVQSLIDFYVLAQAWYAYDVVTKNTQLCTWDGNIWAFLLYDLDTVFGLHAFGYSIGDPTLDLHLSGNRILSLLANTHQDEIKARYWEIRESILSPKNIEMLFSEFMNTVGIDGYNRDATKWTDIPSNRLTVGDKLGCYTSLPQVMDWYNKRI
ncbi:CotH kinase family protein, partial [Dysgonomonas sp. 216]|uniref:CotH kinase family protein n=1 Tax=Dysgonomonas sp. 216 TaxID=2302934 RepID=UPI0013D43DAB